MTADQLVRCLLERAIADGLVLPATDRFANPDPLARTYLEVLGLAEMIVRWQKGLTLRPRPWLPKNQVGGE